MAKLTAWLVTVIGVLLVLALIGVDINSFGIANLSAWLIALCVLVIGITKLMRNYNKKRK
ncbi:MAG: hypothetical protein WC781_03220 [Candidatus Pacearchaeota archaeon]|jgi:hypothetical protein